MATDFYLKRATPMSKSLREFKVQLRQIDKVKKQSDQSLKVELLKSTFRGLLKEGENLKKWPYFAVVAMAKLEVLAVDLTLSDVDRLLFKDYQRQICRQLGYTTSDFQISFSTSIFKAGHFLAEYNPIQRFYAVSNSINFQNTEEQIELFLFYRNQALIGFVMLRHLAQYNLVLVLGLAQFKDRQKVLNLEKEIIDHLRSLPGQLFFADRSAFVRPI
jgi:hypothetical protein